MLKTNHSLQSLSLSANAFEDSIAEILAEAFEVVTTTASVIYLFN